MKVIIPTAGKGTRLRPHTHTRPKALVSVAGKTILEHVMANLEKLNIEQFIIIVDENGNIIEEFFRKKFPEKNAIFVEQKELLGPAHAVWLSAPYISEKDDVLIVFNDTLFITDLTKLNRICDGLDGLIYSKEVEDYKRFGVNIVKDGIIIDMVEKPDQPISKLAQVGLYYIRNGKALISYIEKAIAQKLTVKGEYYLPAVFKLMIADGFKLGAPEIDEWLDCGQPETLLQTNRILLQRSVSSYYCIEGSVIIPPVYISKTARIIHSVVGPYVSIADGCIIEDSIIKDSVINANSRIKYVILEKSIIGESVNLIGLQHKFNIGDSSHIEMGNI